MWYGFEHRGQTISNIVADEAISSGVIYSGAGRCAHLFQCVATCTTFELSLFTEELDTADAVVVGSGEIQEQRAI